MADDLHDLPESFQTGTGIAPDQAATASCHIFSSSSSTNKPNLKALWDNGKVSKSPSPHAHKKNELNKNGYDLFSVGNLAPRSVSPKVKQISAALRQIPTV